MSSRPRMMSLDELKKREAGDDKDNTYYAGGEKSGMAIEGNGGASGGSPHDLVNQILQRAREGGARPPAFDDDGEEYSDEDGEDVASGKQKVFSGAARKITDSGIAEAASASSSSTTSANSQSSRRSVPRKVTRTLTFWQDGFSLDQDDNVTGALHPYSEPASQRLLQILQSGQAPLELLQVEPGQAVDLRVVHRMGESYRRDDRKSASSNVSLAFAGKPQRLGDMAEPVKSPSSTTTKPATGASASSSNEVEGFDPSKPATTLQLRLSNGTRQTATLNTTQTIRDLYNHVSKINSNHGGSTAVTLLAGRPPVKLEASDERTLTDAGLLGSVIIVQ